MLYGPLVFSRDALGLPRRSSKRATACANLQRVEKITVVPLWSHLPAMSQAVKGPPICWLHYFARHALRELRPELQIVAREIT
jgi:hypothetical protein